jgi:glycerol-3-phosphate dehydrogenase
VVLFEKGDFASGTSSKSTKLLHGGIRYLEQARFSLVFESLHERRALLEMVPHLAHPLSFLLPSYSTDSRPAWMLKIGLWLYDLLAGKTNIARHQWFSPAETLRKAPQLNQQNLKGCGLYFDVQVNDTRLVLENILAAEQAGAHCFNYCRVGQVDSSSSPIKVFYHNDQTNEAGVIQTTCLVNASGPWANETAKLISDDALKLVRPTRGTHIVVPTILSDHAVLVTTPKDNRIIFVIPWRSYSLIGTTDLDDLENPDKVKPTEEEIQYLLTEASRVFPQAKLKRNQVFASFAGLRPLAWSDGGHASSVSREDKIIRDGSLLTIVGGKLTTYRSMAQKALGLVFQVLQKGPAPIPATHLPGTPPIPWKQFLDQKIPQWISTYGVTESQAQHLANLYGQRTEEVLELIKADQKLKEPLHPNRPELLAQVVYAVQKEKAVHLEDVMLRRLEIGYSPERWGEASQKTCDLMASLLNWDKATKERELEQYRGSLFPPIN